MNLAALLRNIEERLTVLELSADAASRKAGKPDAIRNLRRKVEAGKGGMNQNTLEALARALETTSAALLDPGPGLPAIDQESAPQLREYLLSQRALIDRQLAALDAVEKPKFRRRAKNR